MLAPTSRSAAMLKPDSQLNSRRTGGREKRTRTDPKDIDSRDAHTDSRVRNETGVFTD